MVGSQLLTMASLDNIGKMTWSKWNAFNEKIKKACEIVKKADKDGYVSRTPEQEAELLSCREIVDDLPSLAVRMAFIRDTLEHEDKDKGLEHETIVKACLTELDDGTLEFDPFQAMKMVDEKEKKVTFEKVKDYTRIKLGGNIGHWAEYTELHDVLGDPQYGPDVNLDGQNNTCEWVLKFSDGYVVRIYDYGVVDCGTVDGKTDRSHMHWHLLSVPDMSQGYQNFWGLFSNLKMENA